MTLTFQQNIIYLRLPRIFSSLYSPASKISCKPGNFDVVRGSYLHVNYTNSDHFSKFAVKLSRSRVVWITRINWQLVYHPLDFSQSNKKTVRKKSSKRPTSCQQCGCRPEPAESPRTVPLQFGLGSPRDFGRGPCGVGVGRAGWMLHNCACTGYI